MEVMTVDVRVGAPLKEYIVATNGSDLLVPEKDTVLWAMLKLHLVTATGTYRPIADRTEYVRISLRPTKDAKTLNLLTGEPLSVNTLFRNFLSSTGENIIRKHFEKEFKKSFRDYMSGALNNNPDINIKDAIEEFCKDSDVKMNKITYDMLKKDWYRFRKRKHGRNVTPLIY